MIEHRRTRLARHAVAILARADEAKRRALDGIATRQDAADERRQADAQKQASAMRALLLVLLALPAMAGVVYDNGPYYANGDEMSYRILADDFTLAAPVTVTGVRFWHIEYPGYYQGGIAWFIHEDSGSAAPGTVVASGYAVPARTLLGTPGWEQYQDDFAIPALALAANTRYWLALNNGPLSYTTFSSYYWNYSTRSVFPALLEDQQPFGDGWTPYYLPTVPINLAFQLMAESNGVPEPGAWALLAGGLAALTLLRRRRA